MTGRTYQKALKSKKKYAKKFGDDSNRDYPVVLEKTILDIYNALISKEK